MTDEIKETDKEVLRRIMSEPTFELVRQAAIRENAKRKLAIAEALRSAKPEEPVSVRPDICTDTTRTQPNGPGSNRERNKGIAGHPDERDG